MIALKLCSIVKNRLLGEKCVLVDMKTMSQYAMMVKSKDSYSGWVQVQHCLFKKF